MCRYHVVALYRDSDCVANMEAFKTEQEAARAKEKWERGQREAVDRAYEGMAGELEAAMMDAHPGGLTEEEVEQWYTHLLAPRYDYTIEQCSGQGNCLPCYEKGYMEWQ